MQSTYGYEPNGTDYNSVEAALELSEEMREDVYFSLYPNDELELMIADIVR